MGVLQVMGSLTGNDKKFEPFIVKVQDGELQYFNAKTEDAKKKEKKKDSKKKEDDMVRLSLSSIGFPLTMRQLSPRHAPGSCIFFQ